MPSASGSWCVPAEHSPRPSSCAGALCSVLETRLSVRERAQVAARAAGILALRGELDADAALELVSELGLPSRHSALAQFDALTARLLASA